MLRTPSPQRQSYRKCVASISAVIPGAAHHLGRAKRDPRWCAADPGPKYPGIRKKGTAGVLGSRLSLRSAGMTTEETAPYAIASQGGRGRCGEHHRSTLAARALRKWRSALPPPHKSGYRRCSPPVPSPLVGEGQRGGGGGREPHAFVQISARETRMAGRLTGKVALVTAAGQGIGRAIAEAFAAEGAEVIATDIDAGKVEGLKAAMRDKLDVRSTEAVTAMAEIVNKKFGALDVLANIAGYVHQGTIFECGDAEWDLSFDLNVKSMHRTIKAFLPAMLKQKRGSIINMSSAVSSIRGVPQRYVYGATKAAVIGLTKAVAADFIRHGIRCNA